MPSSEPGFTDAGIPWQMVLDHAAAPMAVLDLQDRFLNVNEALCRLFGYEHAELLPQSLRDLAYPKDPSPDTDTPGDAATGLRDAEATEKRFLRSDNSVVLALQCNSVIRDSDGRPSAVLSQFQDVPAGCESEKLWQRTFANAPIGMALLDLDGHWTAVNDAWCELLGYSQEEMLSMRYSDVTYPDDQDRGATALADLAEGRLNVVSLKKRYRHKDGHPLWVLIRTSVVPGADDRPAYLVSQCEELSERRMADAHLAHLALHDPLTGLANRALLSDRLGHDLAQLDRGGGVVAVLIADLDELKPVNDRYGHFVGDQLLITAADQLLKAVRAGDTVARIGGDEFAVISHVADVPAAGALRDRIAGHLQTETITGEYRLTLRASVGLAMTKDATSPPEALLHSADRDMYARKRQDRTTGPPGPESAGVLRYPGRR